MYKVYIHSHIMTIPWNDIINLLQDELTRPIDIYKPVRPQCQHQTKLTDRGIITCSDCGEELESVLSNSSEFKLQRCSIYHEKSGIYKELEKYNINNITIDIANELFMKISNGHNKKIFRGRSRKAIMYATVYYASWKSNHPISPDELMVIMNISRKQALNGLKRFAFTIPPELKYILTIVHTDDLVLDTVLQQIQLIPHHEAHVRRVYQHMKKNSVLFSKSRPRTIVSCILYVLCKELKVVGNSIDKKLVSNKIILDIEEYIITHHLTYEK